jgi:hypothetical protein
MRKTMWKVDDGPLEGELFTLDADEDGSRFSFTMPDGRVAVYRTFIDDDEDVDDRHILIFVGIDSFA